MFSFEKTCMQLFHECVTGFFGGCSLGKQTYIIYVCCILMGSIFWRYQTVIMILKLVSQNWPRGATTATVWGSGRNGDGMHWPRGGSESRLIMCKKTEVKLITRTSQKHSCSRLSSKLIKPQCSQLSSWIKYCWRVSSSSASSSSWPSSSYILGIFLV